MIRCSSCSSQAPDGSRHCPSCGTPLSPVSELTTVMQRDAVGSPRAARGLRPSTADAGRISSSEALGAARFIPGTLLAGRYRIVALLGKGGMGEVYRAEDLKLRQSVALKFLPRAAANESHHLKRLLNEVRPARQISHPNVCRLYDVSEAEGHHFLSMEYVDGEDLASLLKRIGRLPPEKAVQIAQQLCSGLAAAHEQGILHRDLKPANIMLDGRGRARITDFGLAVAGPNVEGREARDGTPAYQSPEQIAGREATVRSDVFALGLVLFELFTGRRAFPAHSFGELKRQLHDSTPPRPSSFVEGIDPAVESVILRCLEKDPEMRPVSALAVAASLPGGDPLAAALAAGETPSPQVVANAGEAGRLRPLVAIACAVSALAGIVGAIFLSERYSLLSRLQPGEPPDALVMVAQQMIRQIGYTDSPADSAHSFGYDGTYAHYVEREDPTAHRWDRLASIRPSPMNFWYRQSPRPLVPIEPGWSVSLKDPPQRVPGSLTTTLDPQGRLTEFQAIPPELDPDSGTWLAPDWSKMLSFAGLHHESLRTARPQWNPLLIGDHREAWEGTYPDQPDVPIRVEAGSYHGRPVWFRVFSPGAEPRWMGPILGPGETASTAVGLVFLFLLLGSGVFPVRRNVRAGRSKGCSAPGRLLLFGHLCRGSLDGSSHDEFWRGGKATRIGELVAVLGRSGVACLPGD